MKMKTYRIRKPKIVVIGGGTGLPVILKSLRNQSADITAVVTVADDGGSSGELRDSIDMAPPGDLRNVLAALSDMPKLYEDLFQYRFHESDKFLANHTIGNLLIAALSEMRNSTYEAIQLLSMMMHVDGHIYPSSEMPLVLHADFDDGTSAVGESKIAIDRKNIEKVYVTDKSGEKNRPNKKKIPVVTAVSPERPPTAIPAEDSTYAPTGEVPSNDPANIAVESDANAFPTRGILLSFMKPA